MTGGCRVVKVGGSLFQAPGFCDRLADWISNQPPSLNVIVTGGGVWADQVRELDRTRRLDPTASHWLAIRAMSLTAWMLFHTLPGAEHSDCFADVHTRVQSGSRAIVVFDPMRFLRCIEAGATGVPLPVGWHVTSDSIAARLAAILGASELVVLKSVACPDSIRLALREQIVDGYFVNACRDVRSVRLECLFENGEQGRSEPVS